MSKKAWQRAENPADSGEDFMEIGSEALSVFRFSDVHKELEIMTIALQLPMDASAADDMEDEKWQELITGLTLRLGPALETGSLAAFARSANERQTQALAFQLGRAMRALDEARLYVDDLGGATGALLPTSFSRRIDLLLGRGVLPLAWIRRLDVLRF